MPKAKPSLDKLKHPNSRKTISLAKKMIKGEKKNQNKLGTHIKNNLIGEKIMWFKERVPPDCTTLTKEQTLDLVQTYLSRFDEELEQIAIKNSVGQRKSRQHASREDIIKITKEREVGEFESCGLEMPDLMNPQQMEVLKNWNGELRFLQHFKLKRISRKMLQD
ncbi:PREDICTED: translation machinery-associated protein 16 homolog [Papilio xuthus]|uniref:Translation machinery-associated protein 16 homolog n=1 Tax=Papilio xuthus TaxID=66420 RepID=A0AAJ6Z8Z5_PAPXU|nr:PREDICTED: translation machinery-associated protein 16 homolog [Papilio xuthus]